MRKVTNSRNQNFFLDESTKRTAIDGDEYKIQNMSGYWVKILRDTSREKQLEIEIQIRNGVGGDETPREIVSGRGRFVGYIFTRTEPVLSSEPDPSENWMPPAPTRKRRNSIGEINAVNVLGTLTVGVGLTILQLRVFYPWICSFISRNMLRDISMLAIIMQGRGFTGVVAGTVLLILGVKFFPKRNQGVYIILEAAAYLAGAIAIAFVVMGLAIAIFKVVQVVIALLPVIIVIAIIVFIIKMFFGRNGRIRRRW